MRIKLFPKQELFFNAHNRINIYSGGIQSAKTTTGALRFLYHGLLKHRASEDNFLVAADTYKTLNQATIPTFMKYARHAGFLNRSSHEFKTRWGSTVYFRTATDPESVEGIPNVRRVWLDEGGKVSLYFFENLMGRAARVEAPVDITSTPYAMNWLAELAINAKSGKRTDVTLVHCKSAESPYFSRNEYERQRGLLDPRRFAMKYDGEFGQMQGLVYDVYENCLTSAFALPPGARYYLGVDWGYYPDPFALTVRAITPDMIHYRVGEYYQNFQTIPDIVNVIKSFDALYHFELAICDPSQPAHIETLCREGIPAIGGMNDIRFGIDQHYYLMKTGKFFIFDDMCKTGIDEYSTYHYPEERELKIDEGLRPRDQIPVDKHNHGCDADRYVTVYLLQAVCDKHMPVGGEKPVSLPKTLDKKIAYLKQHGKRYSGL